MDGIGRSDNVILTFGDDTVGQLGTGSRTHGLTPSPVKGALDVLEPVSIACGPGTTACVTDNGGVFMWGAGIPGDEDMHDLREPHSVSAVENVVQIAIGGQHRICVIDKTTIRPLYLWGDGSYGKLGNGTWDSSDTPDLPEVLDVRHVSSISAGNNHSLASTTDGELFAFGSGASGQLGLGDCGDRTIPTEITTVSINGEIVKTSGETHAKNNNNSSDDELMSGNGGDSYFHGDPVVMVSAGGDFSACVTSSGKLFTWGFGAAGQLGHGDTEDRSRPTQVLSLHNSVKHVSCGYYHMIIVLDGGDVYTCGSGTSGKLGLGSTQSFDTPQKVDLPRGVRVSKAAAGWDHSALLTESDSVYTFGRGSKGRLGHGGEANEFVPRKIEEIDGVRVLDIACGGAHTAVLARR